MDLPRQIALKVFSDIFRDYGQRDASKIATVVMFAVFTGLGVFQWAQVFRGVVMGTFDAVVRRPIPPRYFGPWAVVTGCTQGIGLALAEKLAARGMSLLLVARDAGRLQSLAARLQGEHAVQARAVAVDLSAPGDAWEAGMAELRAAVAACEGGVGVLYNNAGVSYDHAEYLHELDAGAIARMIQVNVASMTEVVRCVLPSMLERRRGCVVNVGSGSASIAPADPLYSVYAGTKAYAEGLTRSLAAEYAGSGVRFQLLAPLFVATRMSRIRVPSVTAPSAPVYAEFALRRLGRDVVTAGYPVHSVLWWVIAHMPERLFVALRLGQVKGVRQRALAKKQRAAAAAKRSG